MAGVTRIRIRGEDGPPVAGVGPARVVHGDYRLDNMVLSHAGRVRVVLDWELYTLGDPLAAVVTATARSSIMAR